RVDERQAAAKERRERPRHLRRCKLSSDASERGQPQHEMVEACLLPWSIDPTEKCDGGADDRRNDEDDIRPGEVGDAENDAGDKWKLRAKVAVVIGEGRHHL